MTPHRTIQYLQHHQVDKARWDAGISAAPNSRIYAQSFYLDAMAPGWHALVSGDYEWLMPLPVRKKLGLWYVYYPPLIAQLGVFGEHINGATVNAFLHAIPKKFRLWDFPLNPENSFASDFTLNKRVNYVLRLDKSYGELRNNYRDNIKRNVKKAQAAGCVAAEGIGVNEITALATEFAPNPPAGFDAFEALVRNNRSISKTYGIFLKEKLLASAVFLFDKSRAYYILVGNHPDGRTIGASHMLIDHFIQQHAGQNLLLDFEGSDLRNLAFFYSSFGAAVEYYPTIYLNRLPFWLRWMKR